MKLLKNLRYLNRLTVILGIILLCSCNLGKGSRLCSPQKFYDLIYPVTDSIVHFKFLVSNCGSDTLVIKEITSSCGCHAINNQFTKIQPDGITIISGKIKLSQPNKAGNETHTLAIRTNQQDTPIHFFKIKVIAAK
ncbi:MAG: DUF1573 domain-containing protein [Chitinophagaceae bacterium]|nr:DUF1573 domain-containing protein [Chitinophagaceae bacterium]